MESSQQRVGDFYTDVVLPALAERLDVAFPEFGWKRDRYGWVATNQEMTHRVLGVRANRVVAHGSAPPGFFVHGGEPTLWTAYVSGGDVPRGEPFVSAVKELAARAGIDASPIEQRRPRDCASELLEQFFELSKSELRGNSGAAARAYLERRGFATEAIHQIGLGVVPHERLTKSRLHAAGFTELEIAQSGVLADGRWPGRLCGAWRDERGRIGTLWARSLRDGDSSTRYLYLRGRIRTGLPPYGVDEALRLSLAERHELVVVEGLIDVHRLRSEGFGNIAAAGGAQVQAGAVTKLRRHGVESVVLAFDNDAPGRQGATRAVDTIVRAKDAPALRVVEPSRLADSKDPDAFVRTHGIDAFRSLVDEAECAVSWRAREFVRDVTPESRSRERRAGLARAGEWLGSLAPRYALEQEDAVRQVADRCGYSSAAVERAFRARFWREPHTLHRRALAIER